MAFAEIKLRKLARRLGSNAQHNNQQSQNNAQNHILIIGLTGNMVMLGFVPHHQPTEHLELRYARNVGWW